MSWKVVEDVVVPKSTGKTMKIKKGQTFRVIEHEGKQVVDLTFLNAQNVDIGNSLCEKDLSNTALSIMEKADNFNCKIILPIDAACANNLKDQSSVRYCDIKNILPNQMVFDVGNKSALGEGLRSLQRSLETIERRKNQEEASSANIGAVIGGILFLLWLIFKGKSFHFLR